MVERIVDVILAEELMRAIDDASDRLAKIELLRKFHALFQGEFMGTTFTRNSFIRENRLHYKLKYIEKMEVLMKLLIEQGDYNGAAGYCNDILKVYPDCVDIHFWRIVALTKSERRLIGFFGIFPKRSIFYAFLQETV